MQAASAIDTAVALGAQIINMSLQYGNLAFPNSYQTLRDKIVAANSAGVTVVVAAGNLNKPASGISPANIAETITVGAVSNDYVRTSLTDCGEQL